MSIFKAFNPSTLPESVQKKTPLAIQREMILQLLLNIMSGFGVVGLILFLLSHPIVNENLLQAIPFSILFGVLLIITVARKLPYPLRAGILAFLISIVSLYFLLQEGLSGTALIYSIAFVSTVAVLFSPRAGFFSIVGVILIQAIISWMMITGHLNLPPLEVMANSGVLSAWINTLLAVLLTTTSLTGSIFQLTRGFTAIQDKQTTLTEEVKNEHQLLESRVIERTAELLQKNAQLEAARLVAIAIAGATNTAQVVNTAAEEIKEKFGFFQVNIFLNDERHEYTILRASTGEVGKKLLESSYRLKIGETGIVGFVADKGKPRIARDVEGDPNYVSDPALPETRSEFAVPLFGKGNIVGVLDIQSNLVNAFPVNDIEVITSLAEQLSQAIENARLLEDLQRSLNDLENNNLHTTQAAWDTHLRTSKRGYAFRYRQARIEKTSSHTPESLQALKQGATVVTSSPAGPQSTQPFATLAIPIKIRHQTLGVINMRVAGARVSPELIELVEGAVNRLSASLENARLLEDLQARSERDRLVGDIASKVRTATDIDSILRTTAGELGRSLGVSEVVIQLNTLK